MTIVISTTFQGSKRYVTSYFNRFDKTVNVELSTKVEEAKDFGSRGAADFICRKIFNPFDRTYIVEEMEIQTKASSNRQDEVIK